MAEAGNGEIRCAGEFAEMEASVNAPLNEGCDFLDSQIHKARGSGLGIGEESSRRACEQLWGKTELAVTS